MERITALGPTVTALAIVAAAVLAAVIVGSALFRIVCAVVSRSSSRLDDLAIRRLHAPSRWLLIAIALAAVQPVLPLDEDGLRVWSRVAGLLVPALLGWLAIACLGTLADVLIARADITVEDNLNARRRQTRIAILKRIGVAAVLLITICFMLMSIPGLRTIGVSLIASAGLIALLAGAAAQPVLKNFIAGVQMAFTEPIRLDDVVIIEGEWGRIEEIRLTYVVVKLWDERRLVVPVSRFLEQSFENWTRQTSQILGSVFFYLDPSANVDRLRARLGEIVEAHPKWDRRVWKMQVTDTRPEAIEVRALMTAKDASAAFELRCDVREAMLSFIRAEMPEAIVRHRGELHEAPKLVDERTREVA